MAEVVSILRRLAVAVDAIPETDLRTISEGSNARASD
jgi:hypothetical protein